MKYIVKADQSFKKVNDYCSYGSTTNCNGGSSIGTGNYTNVNVGL